MSGNAARAIGRRELASQSSDESDEAVRQAMVEAQIFLAYRRDLNNLSIQESRLRRLYEKDEAELNRIINEREQAEEDREKQERNRWRSAVEHYETAKEYGVAFDPAEIGFEFSTREIAAWARQRRIDAAIQCGRYYEYKAKGRLDAA